jgi:hypothetical protein
LKRFNEKMLKAEKFIEPITSKALISGVKEKILWKKLYALLDRRLLKVKQAIDNYIQVEEVSMTRHDPLVFQEISNLKGPSNMVSQPNRITLIRGTLTLRGT